MAQQQSMPNNNNGDNNGGATQQQQQQQQQHQNNQRLEVNKSLNDKTEVHSPNPIFHDFFGGANVNVINKPNQNDSSAVVLGPNSPSASFAASSARGPISSASASDLASERRVGNHLEGVPFYGPRSDISGIEISNKIAGTKRCKSDSTFMGSSRDGIPQIGPESLEGSHLMKLLRNGAAVERVRRSIDEEATFGSQQMRPTSASLIFQPPPGVSKLDKLIPVNVGPAAQYPPRGAHFVPFVPPHVLSNRFREANAGPSNISQSAADEGSRTGIKGPRILGSLGPGGGGGTSERNPSGSLPSSSRQKAATGNVEPESSAPSGQHGFAASRQMTIFYGGQAHVFDDVHPNKADVIMALAGSNGGSWSTSFSPKQSQVLGGESEPGNANNAALLRDYQGRSCFLGNSSQGVGFGDQISIPTGGHPISKAAREMRNSVQAMEHISKEKNEL